MYNLSWHAQPNLVLVFPTHHMFIHDDEYAIIRISLVFMGIYMYTFIYLACTNFNWVLVFSNPTTFLFMTMKMQ